MLLLTGEYQHVIDGKNRILISNKIRSQIDSELHGSNFYLVLGANGILCLYPEKYFERIILQVGAGATAPDEAVSFERMSFALASKVELDTQGRLLLPERNYGDQGKRNFVLDIWVSIHFDVCSSNCYTGQPQQDRQYTG